MIAQMWRGKHYPCHRVCNFLWNKWTGFATSRHHIATVHSAKPLTLAHACSPFFVSAGRSASNLTRHRVAILWHLMTAFFKAMQLHVSCAWQWLQKYSGGSFTKNWGCKIWGLYSILVLGVSGSLGKSHTHHVTGALRRLQDGLGAFWHLVSLDKSVLHCKECSCTMYNLCGKNCNVKAVFSPISRQNQKQISQLESVAC